VARRRAARGSWGSGKRPVKAAVGRRGKQREGGLEVDDEDLSTIFQKVQGLHCKAKLTFKP
jgi:hypothetical protein